MTGLRPREVTLRRRFWHCFTGLPRPVQELAVRNYQIWKRNPLHPSLRFRRLQGTSDLVTVRVGDHHRAIGMLEGGGVVWLWIGSHAEYDRLVHV